MDDYAYKLVNYSEKAIALLVEYDGVITDELKIIGGKFNSRLSCGPGWIFSRAKSFNRLTALFDAYEIKYNIVELADVEKRDNGGSGAGKSTGKEPTPGYIINATADIVNYAERIGEYDPAKFPKNYPIIVVLTDGEHVPIGSDSLKTEFWFPDEGHDEEIEQAHTEEYFIAENTEKYDHMIAVLNGTSDSTYKYCWLANWNSDNCNRWSLDKSNVNPESVNAVEVLDIKERNMYRDGLYRKISDEDRKRLLKGYEMMRDATIRRCRTWLKRYGVEKLSVRTYWRDR